MRGLIFGGLLSEFYGITGYYILSSKTEPVVLFVLHYLLLERSNHVNLLSRSLRTC